MLKVTVTGDLKIQQRLLKRAAKGELLRPILMNVAEETIELVKQCFEHGHAPDGKPWASLKRRQGQPLRDTGRLMNSLARRSFGQHGFIYGTDVSYAPYHQFGTRGHHGDHSRKQLVGTSGKFAKAGSVGTHRVLTFRKGNGAIPARPFLPLNGLPPAWERKLRTVIRESFDELMGR